MQKQPHWCVIVFAFNEEKTIERVVSLTIDALSLISDTYTVLLIDDGSTDNTGVIIDELKKTHPCIRAIHHRHNKGIGASLRTGYSNSVGDIVGAIPADLQFDPMDIVALSSLFEGCDVVSVYRQDRKDFGLKRKLVTCLDKLIVRILFNLKFRDLHWVKFYNRAILSGITLRSTSPTLDTELLYKATRAGARIVEYPLPDNPRCFGKAKGVSVKNLYCSFIDLLKLRLVISPESFRLDEERATRRVAELPVKPAHTHPYSRRKLQELP